MILDDQGREYRQKRPIGFHGHDQIESDVRAEVKPDRGSLPDYVAYERSDEMVAASLRKRHG